ncbi:hypothetical protein DAEQUDRAFT_344098 [Daedalea quercina L-15889]|uniref:Uncharacterized protein n=1 Tax=Daedalea quercina L-15889 TaxID=1314783 RepID=A0A165PGR6_9APHY|nr:hypothetical protein DAEQUDRAFT_344098 [Daedalea quercina L-15889]
MGTLDMTQFKSCSGLGGGESRDWGCARLATVGMALWVEGHMSDSWLTGWLGGMLRMRPRGRTRAEAEAEAAVGATGCAETIRRARVDGRRADGATEARGRRVGAGGGGGGGGGSGGSGGSGGGSAGEGRRGRAGAADGEREGWQAVLERERRGQPQEGVMCGRVWHSQAQQTTLSRPLPFALPG